ncbi:Chitin synthase, class 3 [Mortierella sp. NVP85]|nr:Chitin synthase, class 3 [Mortierella sp. NVP85]
MDPSVDMSNLQAGQSSNGNPRVLNHSASKVHRKRSLTKPERYRPKPGMLNRTPSRGGALEGSQFQEQLNESTGNLIQNQNTGSSTSGASTPAAAIAAQEQHQQRLRIQQAHQAKSQAQQQQQQRSRPPRGSTLRRAGSKGPAGQGNLDPQRRPSTMAKAKKKLAEREIELTTWVVVSRIFTCCIPSSLLRCCNSKRFSRGQIIQAWREKVTLCMIIFLICGVLAFIIFGLQPALCPSGSNSAISYSTQPTDGSRPKKENYTRSVIIRGSLYPYANMQAYLQRKKIDLTSEYQGQDITSLFYDTSTPCTGYPGLNPSNTQCIVQNPYSINASLIAKPCITFTDLQVSGPRPTAKLSFLWTDFQDRSRRDLDNIIIYDGRIFNVSKFIGTQVFGAEVQSVLQRTLRQDSSFLFQRTDGRKKALECLTSQTEVGVLENATMGCFAAQVIILTILICVCMVVGIKFIMALTFSWFLSYRLTEKPRTMLKSSKKDKEAMNNGQDLARSGKRAGGRKNLYTVMLVTCYSEGESSIRTTMDSLANTSYSSKHKLMMVICDGIVRGHGNKLTTPDIVVNMLELAPGNDKPKPCSYLAIADGEKQHNMAKVYAGHYVYKKKRVPTLVVVKCGNPLEKEASKPGNRGKRDSQLILMSFFQRVLFADRFTELDFEMFHKIQQLMNIWPDRFELCLMVDADTMVKGDSLSYMVTAMQNDHSIMGLCGETKIANKTASWVTAIQVFEYYISHHLGKAFESVFGGVTCLPGCFCMYRLKAPKNDSWVPILANPEIIEEYNQNIVSTLHQKNLLLLGEDRYLTTLMLRTFPKRQMVFVPQAHCKTVVPDTFGVLLSQRRRWINSTIHNLLELVLVTDLCGIAFLSMQFVVLLELVGTVVLPAAILFGIGMIVYAIINQTLATIPLILIIVMLGLPAVLIVLTTRKWIYVLWMFMYLISLPIWNFVLPLYAFWHFDDFSWGETRKVANQKRKSKQDHGDAEGEFESGSIIMRKWEEWEKERLKAMGYRIKRRQSADRGINDLPPPAASTLDPPGKSGSSINLSVKNTGSVRSTGQNSGNRMNLAGASTLSLGSTLNGNSGSPRVGGAGPHPRGSVAVQSMPLSTPNLVSSPQQQPISRGIGTVGRGGRPRPPSQMMNRPPPGSMGPGQSFEMGPMPVSSGPMPMSSGPNPSRVSFIPTGTPNVGGRPPGNPGLEARHSVHIPNGPGYRPMGPRPMRPPMGGGLPGGPPGGPPGSSGSFPMSRPSPQPGFQGAQGPGFRPRPGPGPGPGSGPGPTPSFSGPANQPSAPALLFPNHSQQQHENQGSVSQPLPTDHRSQTGVPYPRPPMISAPISQPLMLPGDRYSYLSDNSGQSGNSGSAAQGSVSTAPGIAGNSSSGEANTSTTGAAPFPVTGDEGDGIVVMSDDFYVPTTTN